MALKVKIKIDLLYVFKFDFLLGTRLKKVITGLEESLDIKTKEAQHLSELVDKMESSSTHDEMNKVQISDLKSELAKSEETLKIRTDELFQSKKDLRVKDEEIQQREIDISCLRGQVESLLLICVLCKDSRKVSSQFLKGSKFIL